MRFFGGVFPDIWQDTKYIGFATNIVGEARMFEAIFGSEKRGKILLYIFVYGESYAAEIARVLGYYLFSVQTQLARLEESGILYSRRRGTVRLFGLNPENPFKIEITNILEKALDFIPKEEKANIFTPRRRPRLSGKPL
jgi:DNA-binding transcriptional ArsR family regulator